jgi:hypothetical protein
MQPQGCREARRRDRGVVAQARLSPGQGVGRRDGVRLRQRERLYGQDEPNSGDASERESALKLYQPAYEIDGAEGGEPGIDKQQYYYARRKHDGHRIIRRAQVHIAPKERGRATGEPSPAQLVLGNRDLGEEVSSLHTANRAPCIDAFCIIRREVRHAGRSAPSRNHERNGDVSLNIPID